MNRTKVEWVKNPDGSQGYSWNPITGCLNGCEYCYARKLAEGRLRARFLANNNLPSRNRQHSANPFYPRFWPERLKELQRKESRTSGEKKSRTIRRRDTQGKGIFVCNMSEMFGEWIPAEWQREIFRVIRDNPQHRFYFLTKRTRNLTEWSPFPDNCWIGATVCDKQSAFDTWWYYFGTLVRAKLKFLSFEPLLEDMMELPLVVRLIQKADWIIIGSRTKPYSPPKAEWVKKLVEAADEAGKPVFLKDNLKPLLGDNLRQEMPDC